MKIKLAPQTVYGRKLYFPACEISKALCKAFEIKSLTVFQMETLRDEAKVQVKLVVKEEP